MPAIRAIVFDLDDTLYAERSFAFSGFAAVAEAFTAELGDPAEAAAEMRTLFDSEDRRRVFNTILERRGACGQEAALVPQMVKVYRTHRPLIEFHADAARALARLRPRYRLGLITDGPAVMQSVKVEALRLGERLDEMILTDTLGPGFGKPNKKSFELMTERLGVEASVCVYVADNAGKDFVAPNALGWLSVKIERPDGLYGVVAAAAGGEPRCAIGSLDDLDGLLC